MLDCERQANVRLSGDTVTLTFTLVELHSFTRKSNTLDSDGPIRLSNLNVDLDGSIRSSISG